MQDLGGFRAVVANVKMVGRMVASFEKSMTTNSHTGPLLGEKMITF